MSIKNIKHVIALLRLLAHMPLGILYFFSDIGFVIVYYIIRYRRSVVRKNLVNSFPEKSLQEIISIEKKFYHSLCDICVESFKCLHISDEELLKRVDVQNTELVEATANAGQSIVMFMGHCGCWEWVQEITVRYKNPTISGEIYKHITTPLVQEIMTAVRRRWNTELVEIQQSVRTILRLHKEGKPFLFGFISDQRAFSPKKCWTSFMHQYSDFAMGGEEIAQRIGAKMVYLDIERTKRGHYRFTFMDINPENMDTTLPYTKEFYRMLEKNIRRQPEIWLWSHNRWKVCDDYKVYYEPILQERDKVILN
ncbi:MAG: lysophospholipid acyltransferase family protein [Prevotella sp.]|nr:lysophospholipid acyltransferase family protein [Candidatus Prevotella equi]